MYVTIKLEGNVGTIHSINVDGEEIIPDLRYNISSCIVVVKISD